MENGTSDSDSTDVESLSGSDETDERKSPKNRTKRGISWWVYKLLTINLLLFILKSNMFEVFLYLNIDWLRNWLWIANIYRLDGFHMI